MKRFVIPVAIVAAALAAPAFAASPIKNATYRAFGSNPVYSLAVHVSLNGKSAAVYSASIGNGNGCAVKSTAVKSIAISSGKIHFDGTVASATRGRTTHFSLDAKWTSSRQVKGTFKLTGKGCSGKTVSFTGSLGQG